MARDRLRLEQLLERVGGDLSFLAEMTRVLLEDLPEVIRGVESALLSGELEQLENNAHKLKGSLYAFGLDQLAQSALALELMGRERRVGPGAEELLADLKRDLDLLAPDLQALAARK